jgi:hypothetical protein
MDSNTALITGALDQLMRHTLTGCEHAAHHAAQLLNLLSERHDLDSETRSLCDRMCDYLESSHV